MMGLEPLAVTAVSYLAGRAHPMGGQVDRALEASLDAVHVLVSARLRDDPALARLVEQGAAGEVSDRTARRVVDAVVEAAESDPVFAGRLRALVEQILVQEAAMGGRGTVSQRATVSGSSRVYQAGRDQTIMER